MEMEVSYLIWPDFKHKTYSYLSDLFVQYVPPTSVPRHNSGHLFSPHLPLQGIYPAQQTYLEEANVWLNLFLSTKSHLNNELEGYTYLDMSL